MAGNIFTQQPLELALRRTAPQAQQPTAPTQAPAPQPVPQSAPLATDPDTYATGLWKQTGVEPHLVKAVADFAGVDIAQNPRVAERAAAIIAQGRSQGLGDAEALAAMFPGGEMPQGAAEAILGRASEFEQISREQSSVTGDVGRSGLAGVAQGVGSMVRGLGEATRLTAAPLDALFGQKNVNTQEPLAEDIGRYAQSVRDGISFEGQKAVIGSTPDGDLFQPSTWAFGDEPSARGYAMLAADVLGSMAPVVAGSIAAGPVGGAVAGGLQGGGAGSEEARQAIEQMAQDGTLAEESTYYREAIKKGMSEAEALEATAQAAERMGFLFTLPVSALGGYATGALVSPGTKILAAQGIGTRIAGRAAISAAEEGTQEAAESIAARTGANVAAGTSEPVTEGTFGDFMLGALGGAVPGAAGGALSRREQPVGAATGATEGQPGATPGATPGAPPSSDPLGLPAPEAVEPPAPSGPLSRATAKGPAPTMPGSNPGDVVTITSEGLDPIEAVVVGETPDGPRIQTVDGEELIIPREEIEAGTTIIQPGTVDEQPMIDVTPVEAAHPAPETSRISPEILPPRREPEAKRTYDTPEAIQQRLAFLNDMGRANGWSGILAAEKRTLEAKLADLEAESQQSVVPTEPVDETTETAEFQQASLAGIPGPEARAALPRPQQKSTPLRTPVQPGQVPEQASETIAIGPDPKKGEPAGFDAKSFDRDRADRIKTSRKEGYTHLDKIDRSVEAMRGLKIEYAHGPQRGTVRTVVNTGEVVVHWDDEASADAELAVEKVYGRKKVWESWLQPSDLKDYRVRKSLDTPPPVEEKAVAGATEAIAAEPDTSSASQLQASAPSPTVEDIREKASIVRGMTDPAELNALPGLENLSFKYDEKAGGLIFSRKHADKVRKALVGSKTPSGDTQTDLSRADDTQKPAEPVKSKPEAEDKAQSRINARNAMLPKGYRVDFDSGGQNVHLFGPDGGIVSALAAGFRTMSPQQQAKVLESAQNIAANRANRRADVPVADARQEEKKVGARSSGREAAKRGDDRKPPEFIEKAGLADEWLAGYAEISVMDAAIDDMIADEDPQMPAGFFLSNVKKLNKAEAAARYAEPGHFMAVVTTQSPYSSNSAIEPSRAAAIRAALRIAQSSTKRMAASKKNEDAEKAPKKTGREQALQGHAPDSQTPPDGWGASNKVFTKDAADKARELLKARLKGGTLYSGIDPEIAMAGMQLMGYHIEAGARRFSQAAKAVADDLGVTPQDLKKYLRAWYNSARDTLEDSGESIEGMDEPSVVRDEFKRMSEEGAPPPKPEDGVEPDLDAELLKRMRGAGFKTISEARKWAKELTGQSYEAGTMAAKVLDETIEAAVVQVAREIANDKGTPIEKYRKLVDLYARQPRLGVRTADSIERQAYSTPVPLAYLASELAGIDGKTTVYEPSAGNGALLIRAKHSNVLANELDPARAASLAAAGFERVSQEDATTFDAEEANGKPVDVVIANPPFGVVKDENGRNKVFTVSPRYQTREIDHAIVFKALDAMKDDGRAVLLIGGLDKTIQNPEARSDAYNTKSMREFYLWLKMNYKVSDHFTVSGDLYAKQGAGWPIDVIVIEGRGEGSRPVPAVNLPQLYESWEALEGKFDAVTDRNLKTEGNSAPTGRGTPAGKRSDGALAGDGTGDRPATPERKPARSSVEPVREPRDDAAPREPGPARRAAEPAPDADARGSAERNPPVARRAPAEEGATQVPYMPASGAKSVDTLVPVNMAEDVDNALAAIREKHGDIDKYVARQLDIAPNKIGNYFSAEQVDALAMAFENIEKNAGFIIGDQTGIGKGRVVAGMIRYALKKGLKPVFITEKPNLYADMYRDIVDVGIPEMLGRTPNILATNSNLSMPLDEKGEVTLKTGGSKTHDPLMRENIGSADVVFSTYSQMQTLKGASPERRQIIQSVISNAVLILDESHNAGGAGPEKDFSGEILDPSKQSGPENRAQFMRSLAGQAKAVMFSSATYAKRPDVMDLYAKTDMSLAVSDPRMLGEAISRGGIPMQQVVASMLSRSGQYLRRERSFKGIDYNTVEVKVDREIYDDASRILDAVRRFSDAVRGASKAMDKELKADGKSMSGSNSTGGAGVDSTNFSSVMHNLIDAMLLSMSAAPAAERAIAAIKDGRKPVITVNNTMGSFISEYASEMGVSAGDPVDLTFSRMFERYLEKSRWVTIRKPFMKKGEEAERKRLTDEELGEHGRAAWRHALDLIQTIDVSGLPVSPIDYIRNEIQKASYKVAEITGRSTTLDYSGPQPVLASLPAAEKGAKGRTKTVRGFNSGALDAVVLNQAGSTGLSLHASERVKDKRPRRMIVAQASPNIDTHMQMLGRVNRTGQVVLPDYEQLAPNIPATIRPAAVLAKKMASLNANTTASRKSALSDDSLDFLNEIGNRVVLDIVRDEPGLNQKLGEPVKSKEDTEEVEDDLARRVTGRIPLLPIGEQERIYSEIFRRYKMALQELEAKGESPLEAKTLDADAVLLDSKQIAPRSGPSPFQAAVEQRTYDIKSPSPVVDLSEVVAGLEDDLEITGAGEIPTRLEAIRKEWSPAEFEEAWEKHKAWAQAAREELTEKTLENFNERQAEVSGHFRSIAEQIRSFARPGSVIEMSNDAERYSLFGIVTRARRSGNTLNPLAASAWDITIQTPTVGSFTVPFSKIASDGRDGQWTLRRASEKKVLADFEEAKAGRREKRNFLTGNLLTAYETAGGRGTITRFTTRDGETLLGIMLPKDADVSDVRTGFRSGAQVVGYAEIDGEITSTDGAVKIKKHGGQIRVEIAAAKSRGGKYYLNQGIREAAGGEFVSASDMMRLDMDRDHAIAVVDAARRIGAQFIGKNDAAVKSVNEGLAGAESAAEAKFSVSLDDVSPKNTAARLKNEIIGRAGFAGKLVESGRVVIHDTADSLPGTGHPDRVQGMTTPDGTIHLVAGNIPRGQGFAVLAHEMLHSGAEALVGSEAWAGLMGRMERILAAAQGREASGWWSAALARMGRNATADELAAYAVENREAAPAGLLEVIDNILGKVKAFVLRRFGKQIGEVTPGELRALAIEAMRQQSGGPGPNGGNRYSVAASAATFARAERNILSQALTQAMAGAGGTNLLGLVPGRALFAELAAKMPAAQEYLRLKGLMDTLRNEWHERMDTTAQEWRKLIAKNGAANEDMMDIMHQSTLHGVDPSYPLRLLGTDEDKQRKVEYARLRERFKALPAEMQQMFHKVRDEYKALGDEFEATLLANIEKAMDVGLKKAQRDHEHEMKRIVDEGLSPDEAKTARERADKKLAGTRRRLGWGKRARMADMRAKFETQRIQEPYFPLARFGQFFVTARDEDGKVVSFSRFESVRQRDKEADQLKADGFKVEAGALGETKLRDMVDPAFVNDVEGILMDAGVPDAVMDQVWQRWLETMPDMSLRKNRLHRKGTPGWNEDALRAFGHHMFHGSHQLARLKYAMDLQEALDVTREQANRQEDPTRAGLIVNEIEKRHDHTMNPTGSAWAQHMTSAAFYYYLAVTPAAAMVNLTQTSVVGTAILGAYHGKGGMRTASRHLIRAGRDFFHGKGHAAESDRLSQDEKDAMRAAYKRGTIDKSQAHDLAGVGEVGVKYSPFRSKWAKILSWTFHHTERMNREVTYLAAYRMAREKGLDHMNAVDKASDLTWKTHFDYQSSSRPRFMTADWARVVFTFRNFQVNMLWRLFRDTHQALSGATKEERTEARRQLIGVSAMLLAHAGIRGVWGYGLIMTLLALFTPGDADDLEDEMKGAITGLLGSQIGGMLLNGVPGHLTGADLTARIGMPDMWFRAPDRQLEGEDEYFYWVEQALGPVFGIAKNVFVGMDMMAEDPWRGVEKIVPKFPRDLLRAARYEMEGANTFKGDPILDNVSPYQVVMQALGFTPAELSEQYGTNRLMKNREARIDDERSGILADYTRALRKGQQPSPRVIRRMQEFNAKYPMWAIGSDTIQRSYRSRIRASQHMQGGISLNDKLEPMIREGVSAPIYR